MTQISAPDVTVVRISSKPLAGVTNQKLLLVGQKTSAGSAGDGEFIPNIGNDVDIWNSFGGENSMIVAMIRRVRKVNPESELDAIFLADDGSATASTGALVIGGTATEAGTLTAIIASKNDFSLSIAVVLGDSADAIGGKIEAAITASASIPVTAVNTLGNVVVTAVNLGTYGNTFGLAIDGAVAGLTTGVTGMSGGATDPDLDGVFDPVGTKREQGVVWPYPDDLVPLTDFLDPRFNPTDALLDGVGFTSKTDTLANLLTLGNAQNSPSVSIIGDKQETQTAYDAPAVFEIPVVKASEFAGIRALRGTAGVNVGQFVIANNAADSIGGPGLASKPYFNTPFPNIPPIELDKGFNGNEVIQLLAAGVWVMGNNQTANTIIAGTVVTTNKTDAAGNLDPTFGLLNFVDTSSAIAEFYFNNLKSRYAQYRLTSGGLIPGRDIANELSITGFIVELYQVLGSTEFSLVQTGVGTIDGEPVNISQTFKDNLTVSIDLTTGLVTINMIAFIIVQFRSVITNITIAFTPNS